MRLLAFLGIAVTALAIGLLVASGSPPALFASPGGGVEAFAIENTAALTVIEQVLLIALFCVAIVLIVWQARPIEPSSGRRDRAGNDNSHLHAADPRPPG